MKGGGIGRSQTRGAGVIGVLAALLGVFGGGGSNRAATERVLAGGLPLARKYLRPSNPAEVRTRYAGPWGTTARHRRLSEGGNYGRGLAYVGGGSAASKSFTAKRRFDWLGRLWRDA
jgi:hypothetical protein